MARTLTLINNTGGAWTISQLGNLEVPAGSPGSRDVTDMFEDVDFQAAALGGLTFSATQYLRIDDNAGTYNITDIAEIRFLGTPLIVNQTAAQHNHEDAEGGAQIVGKNALSDASDSGGADRIMATDSSGNTNMGAGKVATSATTFNSDELITLSKALELLGGSVYEGNVIVPYFVGDADADPGAVGAGKAYVVGTAWGAWSTGDIVERNAGDTAWVLVKAGSVGDKVIVGASPVGDFSAAAPYSIIEFTSVVDPFAYDTKTTASDGMWAVIAGDGSQYHNYVAIYDDTLKWVIKDWGTDVQAGTGLTKSGVTINAGSGVVETRGGISFTANDMVVDPTSAVALQANGGLQINSSDGKLEALTDNISLQVNASNELEIKQSILTGQMRQYFFGRRNAATNNTYLRSKNAIFSNRSTYQAMFDEEIIGIGVKCYSGPGTSCTFEIHINGVQLDATHEVSLSGGGSKNRNKVISAPNINEGDLISIYHTDLIGAAPIDTNVEVITRVR